MDMPDTTWGKLLRLRRLATGVNQAEIADCLRRDQTYVSMLETGKQRTLPEAFMAKRICACYGVSMGELLTAAGYLDGLPADAELTQSVRYARVVHEIDRLEMPAGRYGVS